jgi:hypothetical protein
MPPLGPRERHVLDQYMALHLEVQSKLKQFERDLVEAGYTKGEAWELARRLGERILGPAMDVAEKARYVAEKTDEIIRERLRELDALGD